MNRVWVAIIIIAGLAGCGEKPRVHHHGSAPSTDPVGSPGWVVDQFYGWSSFPSESLYITSSFAALFPDAPTMGAQMDTDASVTSRKLMQDSVRAVYATTVVEKPVVNEVYTFLSRGRGKSAVWKISAIRALHFNSAVYRLIDSLKSGLKLPGAPPTLLGILQLALSSDTTIKEYLAAHADTLAALAEAFQAQKAVPVIDVADSLSRAERRGAPVVDPNAAIRARLNHLFVSAAFRMAEFPGCTFIRIGGFSDRQVGYIYAPAGCTPPVMSIREFILVDPIRPHWYEYKAQ